MIALNWHGQEPCQIIRGCAQRVSLGTRVPVPARRAGTCQGVWGEEGEDVG